MLASGVNRAHFTNKVYLYFMLDLNAVQTLGTNFSVEKKFENYSRLIDNALTLAGTEREKYIYNGLKYVALGISSSTARTMN